MPRKYSKSKNGGFLHSCHIEQREGDSLLFSDMGTKTSDPIAMLNGYAIVPIEKYYKLAGFELDESMKKEIKNFDKQFKR